LVQILVGLVEHSVRKSCSPVVKGLVIGVNDSVLSSGVCATPLTVIAMVPALLPVVPGSSQGANNVHATFTVPSVAPATKASSKWYVK